MKKTAVTVSGHINVGVDRIERIDIGGDKKRPKSNELKSNRIKSDYENHKTSSSAISDLVR